MAKPRRLRLVQTAGAEPFADCLHAALRVRIPRHAVEHGVEQHQRPHAFGCGQRCLEHDPAAHREPHKHRFVDLEVVEQPPQIVGVRVRGVGVARRAAESAGVVADHPGDVVERRHLAVPHACVERETVHEHDRNAVALGLVIQLAARHPQDRHNAIVLRGQLETSGIEPPTPPCNSRSHKMLPAETALLTTSKARGPRWTRSSRAP